MDQNQFTSPFGNPNIKSADVKSVIGNAIPKTEDHPLHMLDNQVDPETKPVAPAPKNNWLQKPIRTYESDIAEALANQKTSVVTMAIAESKARDQGDSIGNKPPSQVGKKIFIFLLSLIFIIAGLMGGYYLYLMSPLAVEPVAQLPAKVPSLIAPDIQRIVSIQAMQTSQFRSLLSENFSKINNSPNELVEFVLAQSAGSTTNKITSAQFIQLANFSMLDTLKRALTDRMMTGVISNEVESYPFIILTTDFFQNAYSGMLRWESAMPEELSEIFNYREIAEVSSDVTSSEASTTVPVTNTRSFFNYRGAFKDKIVLNRDVREFTTSEGRILVLYTFINKNTIAITTSESALKAIIERIEKQTILR
jgi:hypothetical protein